MPQRKRPLLVASKLIVSEADMWTPFGSMLQENSPDYTVGRCCQRNGLVYRFVFKDGKFACAVYLDVKRIA